MMWIALQTVHKGLHIYRGREAHEHILDAALCNCIPEVYPMAAGRMVIHHKIGKQPMPRVHWVGA